MGCYSQGLFRFLGAIFFTAVTASTASAQAVEPISQAIAAPHRTSAFVERDRYRHPQQTLEFFELAPDQTVVEIWPGGGWYTEILAPLLREQGQFYAAQFDPKSPIGYFQRSRQQFLDKMAAQPSVYDRVMVAAFDPDGDSTIAPAGTVDRVLTFRNVHNWYMRGGGDAKVQAAFRTFYRALKPGGILGIVDHRLPADRPLSDQEASGYLRQDYVIRMAELAGFKFVASSEINANPKDNASHPEGVWTLPPTLRLGDKNKDQYLAIGESDRMTLKFIKPE